jgi:hypothetical protein
MPPSSKRDYSKFGPPSGKERKRLTHVEVKSRYGNVECRATSADGTIGESDMWRTSGNGKRLLNRMCRGIVRKTVKNVDSTTSNELRGSSASFVENPMVSSRDRTLGYSKHLAVRAQTAQSKCEGWRVATLLHHLIDALSTKTMETPAMMNIAEYCCDLCHPESAR